MRESARRIVVSILLALVASPACGGDGGTGSSATATGSSSTPSGKAKSDPSQRASAPPAGGTASDKPASTADAPAGATSAPAPSGNIKIDLPAILGEKKDGWAPKVLAGLKRGMSPEEAAKVVPGADKVSKFGFAEVPVKDRPGLDELRFYFKKNKDGVPSELQSVQLTFNPALNTDAFWTEISKACIERYGKADDKEIEKRLITWVGPKSGMAQLAKGFDENHGYTLDITLQR